MTKNIDQQALAMGVCGIQGKNVMDLQVKTYPVLVTVIVLAAAGHMILENIEKQNLEKAGRLLSGFLGTLIVLTGIVKFFDHYTTMFAELVSLSMSSLADLAKWVGPFSEVIVGGILLLSLFWGRYFSRKISNYAFTSVNLALIANMTVALSGHLQYDVPATLLPFDRKYPVLPIVVMAFAARNIRMQHEIIKKNLQHV